MARSSSVLLEDTADILLAAVGIAEDIGPVAVDIVHIDLAVGRKSRRFGLECRLGLHRSALGAELGDSLEVRPGGWVSIVAYAPIARASRL